MAGDCRSDRSIGRSPAWKLQGSSREKEPPMLRAALAGIALSFSSFVHGQTVTAQQVQLLAPQLLAFAGSSGNLAALVGGMAQGTVVTLVTQGLDGQIQVATFTPPAAGGAPEIARALEAARTSLISRGIAAPSAQQIAVALMGGNLTTPAGAAQVDGVLTGTANFNAVQVRNDLAGFAGAGATGALPGIARSGNSVTLGSGAQAQTFSVPGATLSDAELQQSLFAAAQVLAQIGMLNPTPEQLRAALIGGSIPLAGGGSVALLGVLQNRVRNTSDSPFFGTSNSPFFGTSNSPATANTSNTPPTASGAIATPAPDTGIPRGNTAE